MNRKELIESLWYPDGFATHPQHTEGNPEIVIATGSNSTVEILSIYYDDNGNIVIDVGNE